MNTLRKNSYDFFPSAVFVSLQVDGNISKVGSHSPLKDFKILENFKHSRCSFLSSVPNSVAQCVEVTFSVWAFSIYFMWFFSLHLTSPNCSRLFHIKYLIWEQVLIYLCQWIHCKVGPVQDKETRAWKWLTCNIRLLGILTRMLVGLGEYWKNCLEECCYLFLHWQLFIIALFSSVLREKSIRCHIWHRSPSSSPDLLSTGN